MEPFNFLKSKGYQVVIIHNTYGFEKSFLDKDINSLIIPIYSKWNFLSFKIIVVVVVFLK